MGLIMNTIKLNLLRKVFEIVKNRFLLRRRTTY